MDEKLKNVDQSLIYPENTLLAELRRLRKLGSDEVYSAIEPNLHEEIKDIYRGLLAEIEATGDWSNLSIKSYEQEWIEGRMKVVRNLLVRKLPTVFLTLSHNEHKATNDSEFGTEDHYAAPELAILDEQVAMHHVDGRTIEDIAKEKAEFSSRELSRGHEQEKVRGPIAQSPEEIAQSPEEIRRKLAERQGAGSAGKATFGAKDIEPIPQKAPPPKKEEPKEKPAGPARFEARDLSDPKP